MSITLILALIVAIPLLLIIGFLNYLGYRENRELEEGDNPQAS